LLLGAGAPTVASPAASAAAPPQITEQVMAGKYRVVLHIGPVEKMYTLPQYHKLHPKTGEIILGGPMGSMGDMNSRSMNGMLAPHHLEAHIYSARTGAVVTKAHVSISLVDLHTKKVTMVPVMTMQGIGAGPKDLHYGNSVMLMTEHYRVDIVVDGMPVHFTVAWHEPSMSM
jgi:hypothetical protein